MKLLVNDLKYFVKRLAAIINNKGKNTYHIHSTATYYLQDKDVQRFFYFIEGILLVDADKRNAISIHYGIDANLDKNNEPVKLIVNIIINNSYVSAFSIFIVRDRRGRNVFTAGDGSSPLDIGDLRKVILSIDEDLRQYLK